MKPQILFNQLKDRMINSSLVLLTILSVFSVIGTFLRVSSFGTPEILIIKYVGALILISTTVFRKKLHLNFKIFSLLIVLYIIIITGLFDFGFLASAKSYIILVVVVFMLGYSYTRVLIFLIFSICIFILFASLYFYGYFSYQFDVVQYVNSSAAWIVDGITIFTGAIWLYYVMSHYNESLINNYISLDNKISELHDSEQRYYSIFNCSYDPILVTENRKIIDCNDKALQLFQVSRNELIGENISILNNFEETNESAFNNIFESNYMKAFNGENTQFEWEIILNNNIHLDLLIGLSTFIHHDKLHVQFLLKDISQRKALDRQIADYQKHLEMQVQERTYELEASNEELRAINEELINVNLAHEIQRNELQVALDKLQVAQEKLIDAEKMASIGLLTAGVAHEINNPLNFIIGGVYSIKTMCDQEEIDKNIDEIRENKKRVLQNIEMGVERISSIVKSLNHFNRANNDFIEACSLYSVIDNCLLILNYDIKDRISIIKNFSHKDVVVMGNDGKLHQVFLNIIGNSIRSIRNKGEITINIDFRETTQKVKIEVKDNGSGISEENLKKVFEPFFTTKEIGKGTGLGLTIVKKIISDHNGSIEIFSQEGKGTAVEIILPASA